MYEIKYRVIGVPYVGIAYVSAHSEEEAKAALSRTVHDLAEVVASRMTDGTVIFVGCVEDRS